MRTVRVFACLLICLASSSALPAAEPVKIIPDVVYGHKFGMALTFDVFQPQADANGAGVLLMVSGGWYSTWQPPEKSQGMFQPLTDKGVTSQLLEIAGAGHGFGGEDATRATGALVAWFEKHLTKTPAADSRGTQP